MITAWVEGIGVFAPGLIGWEQAAAVLRGAAPYQPGVLPKLAPALLPADVRRRTSEHIRLAIEVASEALRQCGIAPAELASVFATSESDCAIAHEICAEVARSEPQVSPTRFHNSVTNAPAGYWSMAAGSQQPSTSVAGFDASFAVGLLEACAQVVCERHKLMFVAHDMPFPPPLHALRPLTAPFGMALVLCAEPSARSLAKLELQLEYAERAETVLSDAALEALRRGNPAARGLPLLAALARGVREPIVLPYVSGITLSATLSAGA